MLIQKNDAPTQPTCDYDSIYQSILNDITELVTYITSNSNRDDGR